VTIAHEEIDDFAAFGIRAFTTTRDGGSFALDSAEPVNEPVARWQALADMLMRPPGAARGLVSARQVHGIEIAIHSEAVRGWSRLDGVDGHVAVERGIALAVTVADCVPVFLAHPSGVVALLHAGWRGTAAGIVPVGITMLAARGCAADDVRVHLGPAICGRCYEVGADVFERLTHRPVAAATAVDLRALLADQARGAGVRADRISVSGWCTRCHNTRFSSHRAGDWGRQVGVIVAGR
jgi:purine-nucleoside/S-methyl-5'-thioadenosine phosphorylase / adenosine deaminase